MRVGSRGERDASACIRRHQAFTLAPVGSEQWGTHAASLAAMVPMPSDSMRAWLAAMRASRSASYALVAAA